MGLLDCKREEIHVIFYREANSKFYEGKIMIWLEEKKKKKKIYIYIYAYQMHSKSGFLHLFAKLVL